MTTARVKDTTEIYKLLTFPRASNITVGYGGHCKYILPEG